MNRYGGMSGSLMENWPSNVREEQRKVLEEALSISEELEDPRLRARTHRLFGAFLNETTEYDGAREHLEEALRIFREVGEVEQEAQILGILGSVHLNQGEYVEASQLDVDQFAQCIIG